MNLPNLIPISQEQFEEGDSKLVSTKGNRSRVEYYFTCTPSLPLYVLNHFPEVDLITYLDSDLFFFSSPEPILTEMGLGSIAIIPHRFPKHLKRRERNGIYNVGWISFRRDDNGISCLQWWREKCLEWCYDKIEANRFADQKYLNYWEDLFDGVVVINNKGANLASWNISNCKLQLIDKNVLVDDDLLIFFHFNSVKKVTSSVYTSSMKYSFAVVTPLIRESIFTPYIETVESFNLYDRLFNGVRKSKDTIDIFKLLLSITLGIFTLDYFKTKNSRSKS